MPNGKLFYRVTKVTADLWIDIRQYLFPDLVFVRRADLTVTYKDTTFKHFRPGTYFFVQLRALQ